MTEPKFTPGPWKLEARRDICDEFECWLQPLNLHIHDRVSDEDAHLIAAAPELYEALNALRAELFLYAEGNYFRPLLDRAEVALAKARGEG